MQHPSNCPYNRVSIKAVYPRAIKLVETSTVDVRALVTHRFSLEQVADAFGLVAARTDGVAKAMIEPL